MYLEKFNQDLENGLKVEQAIKPLLEDFFNTRLTKLDAKNEFDFKGENGNYYEIKSRTFEHNRYQTTMIGGNKVKKANQLAGDVYFIFVYTDGIYYFKHSPHYSYKVGKGGRKDRGKYEYKENYHYIKIEDLTLLTKENSNSSIKSKIELLYEDEKLNEEMADMFISFKECDDKPIEFE